MIGGSLDILLLQEHRLSRSKIANSGSPMQAKVSFIEEVDHTGVRHMVVFLRGQLVENHRYLYLHDDNLSEAHIKEKSHYFWRLIKDQASKESHDTSKNDCSLQGEPTCKVRKTLEIGTLKNPLLRFLLPGT